MTSHKISPSTTVQRQDDHPNSDIGEEVVVMNMDRGNYYGLGTTGTRIWQLIAEPARVDAVCTTLQQEYKVTESECLAQVCNFLEQLYAEGLIEILDGGKA